MMTKINHVFTNERYYQEIQIRKDCLENTPPSLDESVISAYAGGMSAHMEDEERLKSYKAAVDPIPVNDPGVIDMTNQTQGEQTFNQAFAAARKRAGGKGGTFTYKGKSYHTGTKEEANQ
jgi:hypothetical protein